MPARTPDEVRRYRRDATRRYRERLAYKRPTSD
jgi:hypothetical protein